MERNPPDANDASLPAPQPAEPQAQEPARVFLSHASEDAEAANTLCAALEGLGRRCWIAPRDLRGGMPYGGEITRALRSAASVVVLVSQHANRSPYVLREIDLAASLGVPVVTVRLEEVPPSDEMAFYLGKDQWVDALHPPMRAHAPRIEQALRRAEDGRERQRAAPPPQAWKPPRESVLEELSADLTRYQDLTLKLKATLEEATGVLVQQPEAHRILLEATLAYNAFAPGFMKRLAGYRASVRKYWGDGPLAQFDRVHEQVEQGVYRGALFGLNGVRARLNELLNATAPDPAAWQQLDQDKREPLQRLHAALEELGRLSLSLLAGLEHVGG